MPDTACENTVAIASEVCGINDFVQEAAGFNADIIWGNTIDDSLGEALSVTVIATGFDDDSLSDFLPSQPVETVKVELKDPVVNPINQTPQANPVKQAPAQEPKTYAAGFCTEFPTNDPEKIEHVVLEDIKPMDFECRQAELDFGQTDDSLQNLFAQVQPLRYGSEKDVLDMESQPAYKRLRNQMQAQQQPEQAETAASQAGQMSRMTLSSDGKLRENNSFLFDNVD